MVKFDDIFSLDLCLILCKNDVLCSGIEYTQANTSCDLLDQTVTTEADKEKGYGGRLFYLRPMDQIARGLSVFLYGGQIEINSIERLLTDLDRKIAINYNHNLIKIQTVKWKIEIILPCSVALKNDRHLKFKPE